MKWVIQLKCERMLLQRETFLKKRNPSTSPNAEKYGRRSKPREMSLQRKTWFEDSSHKHRQHFTNRRLSSSLRKRAIYGDETSEGTVRRTCYAVWRIYQVQGPRRRAAHPTDGAELNNRARVVIACFWKSIWIGHSAAILAQAHCVLLEVHMDWT